MELEYVKIVWWLVKVFGPYFGLDWDIPFPPFE